MDFSKIKNIYMIGIKGVGMTMLAQYLSGQGIDISGSDTKEKFMTDVVLKNCRIKVIEYFDATNIPVDADLIIYSTAYNKNNPEVEAALNGKIKTLTYAEALAEIFNQKYGIAITGSHGKTTTTAWLGYVLEKSKLNPSVLVGSNVPQFKGAALVGKSDYLIIEADEYQNKLQYYNPQAVILNNIDYDHPDFFETKENYIQVFIEFIKKIPKRGFLIANFDDKNIRKIANVNCRGKVISYAVNESADYIAYDIKNFNNQQYFKVKIGSDWSDEDTDSNVESDILGDFKINLAGQHNIYNALAVIATSIELGVSLVDIRTYLEEFTGTSRRMEILGKFNGAIIIDDYAHHPTEIKTTLKAIKENYKDKNLVLVFHPHTFTRTKALFKDFSESFTDADEIIVLDIYGSAREVQGGVSSSELVEAIKSQPANIEKKIVYIPTMAEAEILLKNKITKTDVLVLMGAGDVFRIGESLIKN
jgi:UDP-N-acetylmuramate--alanine ligase